MPDEAPGLIRLLLLEDSDIDAELVGAHLRKAAMAVEITRVSTRAGFEAALEAGGFELILSDFSLPDFDGQTALALAQARRPDKPFIFVSGVVGEEFAIRALRLGAMDYVLKRNLARLAPAVERALEQARERSERRLAEAALQQSEMNARLAAEAARLGLWGYAPARRELHWDDTARWIFGAGPDQPLTLTLLRERCPAEALDRLGAALEGALAQPSPPGQRVQMELPITLPGGTRRWAAVHGQVFQEGSAPPRIIGVVRDVTDERLAQDVLRAEAAALEAQMAIRTAERDRIWQLSDELFAVLDGEGRILRTNPAWSALLGYAPGALDGCLLSLLAHPQDRAGLLGALEMLRQHGRMDRRAQRFSHADGRWLWISWGAAAEEGRVYLAGRDVTSEREAQLALAERNQELAAQIEERQRMEDTLRQMQRLEAVGQLTAGVAHDFNNLLTVILGNIGFAERGARKTGDEVLQRRLQTMRAAAERGASLTAQLLAFSRRQRLAPEALDLNETVSGLRELLQSTLGGSVRLEMELSAGLWMALVDPTQIELIILNLAINARDAMQVGGTLRIATANVTRTQPAARPEEPPPGAYVALSVSDTGTGMSPEVLAKAFEPFFTTKEIGKGSGLGLAQVYGFAAQSGGGVAIETQLGVGTTMTVYLPRSFSAAQTRPEDSAPPAGSGPQGCRLLVVDDDAAVREVTVSILREHGCLVSEAQSGEAALARLREGGPCDLLIVDFAMPGMNGAELAVAAQALRPELPVLFVTGFADLQALPAADEARVIRKPFSPQALIGRVSALLAPAPADNVVRLQRR